jgi:hypothetical protein
MKPYNVKPFNFLFWVNKLKSLGYERVSHYKGDYSNLWYRYGEDFYVGINAEEMHELRDRILYVRDFRFCYRGIMQGLVFSYKETGNILIVLENLRSPLRVPLCIGIEWIGDIVGAFLALKR